MMICFTWAVHEVPTAIGGESHGDVDDLAQRRVQAGPPARLGAQPVSVQHDGERHAVRRRVREAV